MKQIALIIVLFFYLENYITAQVAINTDGSAADASAMLEVTSDSKGILIPRLSTTQRTGISPAANGLLVFDTNTKSFWFYEGGATAWKELISSNNNSQLSDSDGDTKIQVEETSDDDNIKFDLGGIEYFVMENGRFNIKNTGNSVFIGDGAGSNDDLSDNDNIFIGYISGSNNSTGQDNCAVGYRTLFYNETGHSNSAFGSNALFGNTGNYNTAMGARTLESIGSGNYNTALGALSMYRMETGEGNTALGSFSLQSHKRNNYNTAVGVNSMYYDTSGAYNTAVGGASLYSNINGDKNTALGYGTLSSSAGSDENTAIGYNVLANSTGGNNTAAGSHALYNSTGGHRNTAIGYKSSYWNTTGSYNTSIGDSSLYSNTEGFLNTAIGHAAMFASTTTWHSVAIGTAAMKNTNGGADNTAVGDSALFSNVSGSYNTALGNSALQANIGSRNTAVGGDALKSNSGTVNTAVGYQALLKNSLGYFNVGVGGYTLSDITTGYGNTVVGYNSGKTITTGSNNTIIGARVTGLASNLDNNIIIADGEGNQRIRILSNGNVGIGTTTPDTKLNVYSASAAEPIAHFQSDDDVSVKINGQGGESYVEIQNDDIGTGSSWKMGVNDNTKLSIQYGSAGSMNNDTEAMKISTDGYIYKPKIPYFCIISTQNTVVSTGTTNIATINYNTEVLDNGNNFDLSTDKFTAPVHGIYFFSWDISHPEDQSMTGSGEYFLPGYVLTSDYTTSDIRSLRMQGTSNYNSYCFSGLIELNSGEEAWISSLAYDDFLVSSSQFTGYLVTALE